MHIAGVTARVETCQGDGIERSAIFHGPRDRFRLVLRRSWQGGRAQCTFIALNPSTADAAMDDPTIRRCIGFARHWGFSELAVVNLFDYRATDPRVLKRVRGPCSRANDRMILSECLRSERVVCAWGNHGVHRERAGAVVDLLRASDIRSTCFGLTQKGQPIHPLYQRSDAVTVDFDPC